MVEPKLRPPNYVVMSALQPSAGSLGTTAVTSTREDAAQAGSAASSTSTDGSSQAGTSAADLDIEAKRAAAANMAWGSAGGSGDGDSRAMDALSLDELQAELARRNEAKSRQDA